MKDFTISKNKYIKYFLSTSSILFLILIWFIISSVYQNDMIFPNIDKIILAFFNIFKESSNILAVVYTILRVLFTVLICFLISFIIVILYVAIPKSIYFFKPLIQIARSTPLAVISIFIFILIGDKLGPYFITILMSLPVAVEGLLTSVDEIPKDIIEELKMLKGNIFIKIIKIYLPIIFPFIVMTFIQTLGMSFKVMIMGEYLCQTKDSIGKTLYAVKYDLAMDTLIAYGILIVIIVVILELIVKTLRKSIK